MPARAHQGPLFVKAADVSTFAPPPIHIGIRDQKSAVGSASSAGSASLSLVPDGTHSSGSTTSRPTPGIPAAAASQLAANSPGPAIPSRTAERPVLRGTSTTKQVYEHKPVSYKELDMSALGPPPPKPFRAGGASPSHNPTIDHPSVAPPQYSPSIEGSNPEITRASGPVPSLPSRASGLSQLAVKETAVLPESIKQKKQPPPKPAKLKSVPRPESKEHSPEVLAAHKVSHSGPNFALEIANRKLKHVGQSEKSLESENSKSEPSMSPGLETAKTLAKGGHEKPAKPVKPQKPQKPTKVFAEKNLDTSSDMKVISPQIVEEPIVKKLPPPKPQKLTVPLQNSSINGIEATQHTEIPAPVARAVPPPPPARSPRNSTPSNASPTPPPIPASRNYVRKAAPIPRAGDLSTPEPAPPGPPDFNLELTSGWYANVNSGLDLPADLQGLAYSTSYQYSSMGGVFTDHTRTITITIKDLSKVTYEIKWKNNDYQRTTARVAEFKPSPIDTKIPTKQQLLQYSEQFGNHIVAWCLHREGQQVGLGECWDLAHDALQKGCGNHAFVSTYYHHGYPILELHGKALYRGPEDEVRKGDILQFTTAVLEDKSSGSRQTAGDPNHTAVVIDKLGDRILVAEQNVQGVRVVRRGEYNLSHLVQGSVVVYRPIVADWAE